MRASKANAYAERWFRTVRTECLDWLLIRDRRHLEHVDRRRVWSAGVTTNPTGTWVAQRARELLVDMGEQAGRFQLLIRDR